MDLWARLDFNAFGSKKLEPIMATWIKCTRAADDRSIILNLDSAISLEREVRDGTLIIFPSHSVSVKESPTAILKRASLKDS